MTPPDQRAVALPQWTVAVAFLSEMRSLDPERAPAASIHAAYYAMFHAARAAIILEDGVDAARTHRGVIARYGVLAGEEAGAREQARALNRAADARMAGDYALDPRPTPAQARLAMARAEAFLAFNAARFAFDLS
jgi:uncharacterized protein (UPF0332 family)